MDKLKTFVGHHFSNLFSDNVAFTIATFLVSSKTESAKRAVGKMKMFYEKLTHCTVKDKMPSFERYTKNLKYGPFGVYSYGIEVLKLNWEVRTAKRSGKWSSTTSRHINYAIQNFIDTWDLKEIK